MIVILITITNKLLAQDSTKCKCSQTLTYKLNYPKKAEENKISGQVIIEIDRENTCILSNPAIKKRLGYGCDEEALRIVKLFISSYN